MKTLVLDPDIARAVLDLNEHPRRCVWIVTLRGEIIVNDLDEGWLRLVPDEGVRDRDWARAIKAAVQNLQHKLDSSLAIYYRFLEATDPAIPTAIDNHTVHVRRRQQNAGPVLVDMRHLMPLENQKCLLCGMAVISRDHAPFCGPECEEEKAKDGTKINWPLPPEILELRKKAQEEAKRKAEEEEKSEVKTNPYGKPSAH